MGKEESLFKYSDHAHLIFTKLKLIQPEGELARLHHSAEFV